MSLADKQQQMMLRNARRNAEADTRPWGERMSIVDPEQLGEEACLCGRVKRKPHCPNCGSNSVYARGLKHDVMKVNPDTGEKYRVATYRCQRCGEFFDKDRWLTACAAPLYSTKATRQRDIEAMNQRAPLASDDDMLRAMDIVKKKRGIQ